MSSPWDPAVAQAMQRHGGSNRSVPRAAQPKSAPPPQSSPQDLPEPPTQAGRDVAPAEPKRP